MNIIRIIKRLVNPDPQILIALGLTGAVMAICTIALIGGAKSEKERQSFSSSELEERQQIMENVKITRTVPELHINYTIETQRLTQYPEREWSELVAPVLTEQHVDGTIRVTTARTGVIMKNDHVIEFDGDVEIVEKRSPEQNETVRMTAEKLTVTF